ncbi:MAG: sulfotransferase family protein [Bacteroidia bacterium]
MFNPISLMIVGAQKAGTTSLKHYLGEHPQVHTHQQKEFSFFSDQQEFEQGFAVAERKYFIQNTSNQVRIAKNAQLYALPQGLKRLHQHNPDCKIVLILRNPVERAYSSYLMERNYGSLACSFEEIVALRHTPTPIEEDWRFEIVLGMSHYAKHLEQIWTLFPKSQTRVLLFEDLYKQPEIACSNLFEWMQIDPNFCPQTDRRYNETKQVKSNTYSRIIKKVLNNQNPLKKFARTILPTQTEHKVGELLHNVNKSKHKHPELNKQTRNDLIAYFRPYNDQLSQLLNRDLSAWNN